MRTVLEILNLTRQHFEKLGFLHPRREAEELIGEALGIGRMGIYLDFERPLINTELELCRTWVMRRSKREPLQYILGKVPFFDCHIQVSPQVLIPRQETEILVDKIATILALMDLQDKVLFDVCCGSGCIGIALKKKFPDLRVICSDLSESALEVAHENARNNAVDIEFLHGDLLAPFVGQKADFIVCNPPYIASHELETLDEEVRLYEPTMALIAGKTGLEFYQRLACDLPSVLQRGGRVWLEIGKGQKENLKHIFSGKEWRAVTCESDWAGLDRFFSLEIE